MNDKFDLDELVKNFDDLSELENAEDIIDGLIEIARARNIEIVDEKDKEQNQEHNDQDDKKEDEQKEEDKKLETSKEVPTPVKFNDQLFKNLDKVSADSKNYYRIVDEEGIRLNKEWEEKQNKKVKIKKIRKPSFSLKNVIENNWKKIALAPGLFAAVGSVFGNHQKIKPIEFDESENLGKEEITEFKENIKDKGEINSPERQEINGQIYEVGKESEIMYDKDGYYTLRDGERNNITDPEEIKELLQEKENIRMQQEIGKQLYYGDMINGQIPLNLTTKEYYIDGEQQKKSTTPVNLTEDQLDKLINGPLFADIDGDYAPDLDGGRSL